MYEIQNGILYRDGEKVFAVGQSYYPSFFHNKYPVPPEGDRLGEMEKDLRDMAAFGFNHVRFAALGDVDLGEDGAVKVNAPFADALCREAHKNGLSVSVRLQGYVLNLRGHRDIRMIDENGREQDPSRWFDFIQTNLQHEGMREDNAAATEALAKHFGGHPGVVGFQIYNEPHFPGPGFFDYHPEAVRAYRKYLADNGIMSAENARRCVPPRSRREQDPEAWARWRLFGRDAVTSFLAESAAAAKKGCDLPVYTCLTTAQINSASCLEGVDCFGNARWADLIGYTCYYSAKGADYYPLCLVLDLNVSAAKLEGKHAWCIEQDARTTIPPLTFNRDVYAALGAGMKGLLFYQWRGDAPSPDTPEPNGFGLINFDRTPTENYENARAMVRLLNTLSDKLVNARPAEYGVGVFLSDHAAAFADAKENDREDKKDTVDNSAVFALHRVYTDLRKAGLGVTVTNAAGLEKSGVKVLFVPKRVWLSREEDEAVKAFIRRGGKAYELAVKKRAAIGKGITGYLPYEEAQDLYKEFLQIEDVLDLEALRPLAMCDHYAAPVQLLQGKGYTLAVVTNIAQPERVISPTLSLAFPAKSAVIYRSLAEPVRVPVKDGKIPLGEIPDGCVVVIE